MDAAADAEVVGAAVVVVVGARGRSCWWTTATSWTSSGCCAWSSGSVVEAADVVVVDAGRRRGGGGRRSSRVVAGVAAARSGGRGGRRRAPRPPGSSAAWLHRAGRHLTAGVGAGGHAVAVGGPPAQHRGHVGRGVVVGEDRPRQGAGIGEVAGRAQQVARARGRVEDVVGVGHPVAVAVLAPRPPRAGQELHRPDGAVEDGVAVPRPPSVSVMTAVPGTEPSSAMPTMRPRVVPFGVDPAAGGVARLDAPDAGQHPPGQVAGRASPRRGCASALR